LITQGSNFLTMQGSNFLTRRGQIS
jgi:hypothetical protein